MRGTRCARRRRSARSRFIPARAGNTAIRPRRLSRAAVHPRACGEHRAGTHHYRRAPGSSPRVRGTLDQFTATPPLLRFIPARAGNTDLPGAVKPHPPVHPRACGEHGVPLPWERGRAGSSPRVRGTPQNASATKARIRFIPARAGNTFSARCSANSKTFPFIFLKNALPLAISCCTMRRKHRCACAWPGSVGSAGGRESNRRACRYPSMAPWNAPAWPAVARVCGRRFLP